MEVVSRYLDPQKLVLNPQKLVTEHPHAHPSLANSPVVVLNVPLGEAVLAVV